jgi:hypothetical protein
MRKIVHAGILFLVFSGACAMGAHAQTEKGDWLIGGILDLNTSSENTSFEFSPNAGYFVVNNLAIGANMQISYDELGNLKVNSFGIGPFVRYYFTDAKIKPFFMSDMNFLNRKITTSSGSNTETAFNYFLGGGAAFFINENVAVEGILGYDHTKVSDEDGSGGLRLRIGFQVYLNRHQVRNVRSSITR